MKRKNGFTLVELLAVIVILAIIALIAVPIVMNVIEDARKGAAKSSAVNYLREVENYSLMHDVDKTKYPVELEANETYQVSNTKYEVSFKDLIFDRVTAEDEIYLNSIIEMKGTKPSKGIVTLDNKKKVESATLVLNSYEVNCTSSSSCRVEGEVEPTYDEKIAKLAPGLYDEDLKEVASWDELVNTYGLDVEQDYTNYGASTTGYSVLKKSELSSGVVLIIGNVEKIGNWTFYKCNKLKAVRIENGVTSIGLNAFYECSSLTSIEIPNSVTSIGGSAFYGCSNLTSITIPSSVTNIQQNPFEKCINLESIKVDTGNTVYEDRNSNAIINKSNNELITGCKNTVIPNSVTSIGTHAFGGCSNLTSITIPNSITKIGTLAFLNCSSLTSITIPSSVTNIQQNPFEKCINLESIKVDQGNTVYEDRNSNAIIKKSSNELISGCKNTVIPNSVTSIGGLAFGGCSNLTSITIPNSVISIGMYAFNECSSLTSITIPSSVTNIKSNAFQACSRLTSITFENPNGWWYADSSSATSGTSILLNDPSQNATYFRSTYITKHFKRS